MTYFWAVVTIAVVLLGEVAGATPAGRVLSTFRQNRSSFVVFEVECTWEIDRTNASWLALEARYAKARDLIMTEKPLPEVQERIDALISAKGLTSEAAKRELLESVVGAADFKRPKGKKPPSELYHYVSPDVQEVHVMISDSTDNPRYESAAARDLESFTGGHFKRVQKQAGKKWVGLDPYPRVNETHQVAWTESVMTLRSMVPPFVPTDSIEARVTNGMEHFESDDGVRSFGEWKDKSGRILHILARPVDKVSFVLAAFDISIGGMPRWTSEWKVVDRDLTFDGLTPESVSQFAKQAEFFRDNPSTKDRHVAIPLWFVYFDSYQQVENAGWYPMSANLRSIRLLQTSENAQVSSSIDDIPFGVAEVGTLTIDSVAANTSVGDIQPLELEDGCVLHDMDTNVVNVVGESPQEAAARLGGRGALPQPSGGMRLLLVVTNLVLLAVIIVTWIIRKRLNRSNN